MEENRNFNPKNSKVQFFFCYCYRVEGCANGQIREKTLKNVLVALKHQSLISTARTLNTQSKHQREKKYAHNFQRSENVITGSHLMQTPPNKQTTHEKCAQNRNVQLNAFRSHGQTTFN